MRVSEILRQLADLVDQTEDVAVQDAGMDQGAEMQQEPGADGGETGTGEITITQLEPVDAACDDESEPATMVSPLQQEHELLKKSQDVDNNVEEFAGDTDEKMVPAAEGAEEDEWTSAMGYDQDDPEEMIGQPDDEVDEDAELARIKQLAGTNENNGPTDHAADCKPVSINPRAVAATEANHGTPDKRLQQTQRKDI